MESQISQASHSGSKAPLGFSSTLEGAGVPLRPMIATDVTRTHAPPAPRMDVTDGSANTVRLTADAVVERHMSHGLTHAAIVRTKPRRPVTEFEINLRQHLLFLHDDGDTARTTIDVDGLGRQSAGNTRGCVGLLPAERRIVGQSEFGSDLRHIVAFIDPDMLVDERTGCGPQLRPALKISDLKLRAQLVALGNELSNPAFLGPLYVESLVASIAVQLVRQHSSVAQLQTPARGGLAPRRLRAVLDLIEANLEGDIRLADLARVAGLSLTHFTRAFRQSTGRAPHQYVIERRVERAKNLLANSDMPLAEIAIAAGFASQSHLTTHFGRALGTTPRRYRLAA